MATTMTRRPRRHDTPHRWQTALRRAISEHVQVRQLAGCGAWIATSSSDPTVAYEVTTHSCQCTAGEFDDPVCKHRARLRHLLGMLTLVPTEAPTKRNPWGLSNEEVIALKADALRHAVENDAPLVNPFTGEIIDTHNCAA